MIVLGKSFLILNVMSEVILNAVSSRFAFLVGSWIKTIRITDVSRTVTASTSRPTFSNKQTIEIVSGTIPRNNALLPAVLFPREVRYSFYFAPVSHICVTNLGPNSVVTPLNPIPIKTGQFYQIISHE